jgi:hypothetical protein
MSALKTSARLWQYSRQGDGLRDACLAFLCSGLGVIGRHRVGLRRLFFKAIGWFAQADQVCLRLNLPERIIAVRMRRGNEADYLVAGELVVGGYPLPAGEYTAPTAIVDGGANIGVFTLQAAARFPDVPVSCYEPEKANLEQLRLNLATNGVEAEIVPKAMWSKTEELFFHPGLSYTGLVNKEPSPFPIACELPRVPAGCWLKLDIEGAEYEVLPALLKGGAKPAIVSMEIHDFNQRGQGLLDLLRQFGYSIHGSFKPDAPCVTICACRQE